MEARLPSSRIRAENISSKSVKIFQSELQTAAAGGNEAGRDDRPDSLAVQLQHRLDKLLGGLHRLAGLLAVGRRAVPVHANLPYEGPLAQLPADVCQGEAGLGVDGGEVAGGGGAAGQGGADTPPVHLGRPGFAAQALLRGEGVLLQPVQQGQVQRQASVGELGGVDVGVDQAGEQKLAG